MYGRKTPSTYRSTPSVYSHYTGKSSTNLRSSKSVRSLIVPWYQKPILHDAIVLDLQRGSLLTGFLSLVVALFTFSQSIFDVYCLYMAAPGSSHTGYYVISYQFVYVGSAPVRNVLIVFALFSWLGSVAVLITTIILINALRKEYEKRIVPWLYSFGVFILFRLIAFIFFAIVNDLIFAYNVISVLIWIVICIAGAYGWLLVYSLYLELADLTKLEDLAHLRMGTMQSLNASLAGSRPTTPHSTVSTMPASQIWYSEQPGKERISRLDREITRPETLSRPEIRLLDRPEPVEYRPDLEKAMSRPQSAVDLSEKTSRPNSLEYSTDVDSSRPDSITFRVEEIYSRPQKTREEGTVSECTPLSTDEAMDSLETPV